TKFGRIPAHPGVLGPSKEIARGPLEQHTGGDRNRALRAGGLGWNIKNGRVGFGNLFNTDIGHRKRRLYARCSGRPLQGYRFVNTHFSLSACGTMCMTSTSMDLPSSLIFRCFFMMWSLFWPIISISTRMGPL